MMVRYTEEEQRGRRPPDPVSLAQTERPLAGDPPTSKPPQTYWLYGLITLAIIIVMLILFV